MTRSGLAEQLSEICVCPVLIVSTAFSDWNKLSVQIAGKESDLVTMKGLKKLINVLGLSADFYKKVTSIGQDKGDVANRIRNSASEPALLIWREPLSVRQIAS